MLNYGLACSNYVNVSNSVVPVFSIVPYMYAVDSYYIMWLLYPIIYRPYV